MCEFTQGAPVAVIFDFDGTLVDSRMRIFAAADHAFLEFGSARPTNDEVLRTIGLQPIDMMARLLPDADQSVRDEIAGRFRARSLELSRTDQQSEISFPGARAVLERLLDRAVPTGIATGKSRSGLAASLDQLGWSGLFQATRTADDGRGKPDPEILQLVLRDLRVDCSQATFVGDTVFDMEMALAAGVRPVGVSWGYHRPQELLQAGAEAIIDRFDQIFPHPR